MNEVDRSDVLVVSCAFSTVVDWASVSPVRELRCVILTSVLILSHFGSKLWLQCQNDRLTQVLVTIIKVFYRHKLPRFHGGVPKVLELTQAYCPSTMVVNVNVRPCGCPGQDS